jgi:hypothetical protein
MDASKYIIAAESKGVHGQQPFFILRHNKMHHLHLVNVKAVRCKHNSKTFPQGESLFIPCYNFASNKTTGYLCAVQVAKAWRLGIIQDVAVGEGGCRHNVYVCLFKVGTNWATLLQQHQKYINTFKVDLIIKYIEGQVIELSKKQLVPLVEVTRYLSGGKCEVFHVCTKDGCFEQPKEGPDFWWQAHERAFEKLFKTKKCSTAIITWERDYSVVPERIYVPAAKDTTNESGSSTFLHTASNMLQDVRVVDKVGTGQDISIFYVKKNRHSRCP